MTIVCSHCAFENPAGFRFCGACGFPLSSAPAERDESGGEAERRQITVLFCDLVGSTSLSEQLDPEDLRDVVRSYQETCAGVIGRYDGYIAQYLGDGVLVYFGYPHAHEDDARRAVRGALEILEKIGELAARLRGQIGHDIQVRIGIDSGLVVIGNVGATGRHEQLAVGETVNIAARVQTLAGPGTVLITEATRRLVSGYFEGEKLGEMSLKGISVPITVYRVDRRSGARDRIDVARGHLTPMIGRAIEKTRIMGLWNEARNGRGGGVLVCGEPGIGKSRLVASFRDRLNDVSYPTISLRCFPYFQNTPFHPVIEMLESIVGFHRNDTPVQRIAKLGRLENLLARYSIPQTETIPLLAALLALDDDARHMMSPQRQRQMTVETLVDIVRGLATDRPFLLVIEDLHWADPSTLDLLARIIGIVEEIPIMLLMTCRPVFVPTWPPTERIVPITLGRLGREEVLRIIDGLSDGRRLPGEVLDQIVERTDGVPLFVEELTKMVLESDLLRSADDGHLELTGPLPPLAIPATLNDSLMARLDRLAPVKEIAQLGATIGREFSLELLSAVTSIDESTLRAALDQLVESEILYSEGETAGMVYTFKHALIQEAAYESLLRSRRVMHHRTIARAIEERFPERGAMHPELLAHHYSAAGMVEQGVIYWERAGVNAIGSSAHTEAIRHLGRGLKLLAELPPSRARDAQELSLTIYLGLAQMAALGYGSAEAARSYARAYELCHALGTTPHLAPALTGLAISSFLRGELRQAYDIGLRMQTMADEGNEQFALAAQVMLGVTSVYTRHLSEAQTHLERAQALHRPELSDRYLTDFGQDPWIIAGCYLVVVLSQRGRLAHAGVLAEEVLERARRLKHPLSLAIALNFYASWFYVVGAMDKGAAMTDELTTLAREQYLPFWLAWGTIQQGVSGVSRGDMADGLKTMEKGFALYEETGTRLGEEQLRAMLADAYAVAGRLDRALATIDDGLARLSDQECHWNRSELLAARARLLIALVQQGHDRELLREAEKLLRESLNLCDVVGVVTMKLRHVTTLFTLLAEEGREREGVGLVSDVLAQFPEGHDLPLLRNAAALVRWREPQGQDRGEGGETITEGRVIG